ncbi:MAG: hypothetical protein ACM3PP_02315 [Candidatus Saccharibacteria bacterium]
MEKDMKENKSAEYTQPLLTKHEPLLILTGKSAEKAWAGEDKDVNEKDKDVETIP